VFTRARYRHLFWSRRVQFTLFYDLFNSILPSQSRLSGIVLLRSKRTYFHMFITKLLSLNNLFSKWIFVSHRKYFWWGSSERKTKKRHENKWTSLRFLIFVQMSIKTAVLWNVVPCISVDIYWRSGGSYCLHDQVSRDYTAQHPRRRPFSNELTSNTKNSRWVYVVKSVTETDLILWWNTMVMVMLMCWTPRLLTQESIPHQRNLVCRFLINTVIVYVWLPLPLPFAARN
jgi:hypothetical protein